MKSKKILIILFCVLFVLSLAQANEKNWLGSGDGTDWADEENWYPEGAPTLITDVLIDAEDATVISTETFKAKSIQLGGSETSTLTINNFIYGTIEPDASSDTAVLNSSGGTFVLTGAGTVTIRGQYEGSKGAADLEPSFMFWVE